MESAQHDRERTLSRRDAIGRVAAGLGIMSLIGNDASAAGAQRGEGATARKPRTVNTVRGPIDTAKLGFTLSHEHICAASAGIWQAWPQLFGGRATFVRTAVDQLKQAKDEGVDSFIDVTTFDLGRDIRLIEEIARKSGIQVIACTGHWLDESNAMSARTVEELADFFVREIEVGIEGTDIKAGVIKVANGATITPFGEKLLRAASRASKATGVPITTHSPATERMGEKQAVIFENEGLSPSSVCIGHSDNSAADYRMGLIKRGYYLGMDNLPRGGAAPAAAPAQQPAPLTFDQRMAAIKDLVDAGFAERVQLGSDHSLGMALQPTAANAARLAQNPDGILFVTRKVVPALKAIGLSEQAIRTMTVDAPRRFFDGA
jgi:phosphotriesterase-related protein